VFLVVFRHAHFGSARLSTRSPAAAESEQRRHRVKVPSRCLGAVPGARLDPISLPCGRWLGPNMELILIVDHRASEPGGQMPIGDMVARARPVSRSACATSSGERMCRSSRLRRPARQRQPDAAPDQRHAGQPSEQLRPP
jgi:hypothetical protein